MASPTASNNLPNCENGTVSGTKGISDIFAIQLEVTGRLLEASKYKLDLMENDMRANMHDDIQTGSLKAKELEEQQNNFLRLYTQHQRLQQEYQAGAVDVFRKQTQLNTQKTRSIPSIGMKNTIKKRATIFGTIVFDYVAGSSSIIKSHERPSLFSVFGSDNAKFSTSEEKLENSDDLKFENNNLVSGTLKSVIEHIVPTSTYYPDRTFVFAFLLGSRLKIRPHELLEEVHRAFELQVREMKPVGVKDKEKLSSHYLQLISEWVDNFPYDYRDERSMTAFKSITQFCATQSPELRKMVGGLQHSLFRRLATLDDYEHLLQRINAAVNDRITDLNLTVNIIEICDNPIILAQQLTHIELERLNNIGPEEFIQTFVKDRKQANETSKDVKKTNNLEAYIEWFNRLGYLIATEICIVEKCKQRTKLIEYFIDVAWECFNLNNFNSLMAIVAGLHMNPVQRLKKSWARVNNSRMDKIMELMNPTGNFATYRRRLHEAVQLKGAKKSATIIPFFSLLVKDLYMINENLPLQLDKGHLNFEKFWQLARQVTLLLSFRESDYPPAHLKNVLNYLMTIPVFTEDELYYSSYKCEEPEHNYEKAKYRTLRNKSNKGGNLKMEDLRIS